METRPLSATILATIRACGNFDSTPPANPLLFGESGLDGVLEHGQDAQKSPSWSGSGLCSSGLPAGSLAVSAPASPAIANASAKISGGGCTGGPSASSSGRRQKSSRSGSSIRGG